MGFAFGKPLLAIGSHARCFARPSLRVARAESANGLPGGQLQPWKEDADFALG